jgi:TP901 family phage tail tape measure protein
VGLSYEYATAALATVTSATRESAETVGTAFKTIFARLESLSLGETLDDNTTLTKYSQALASVGVNIKDQNGELKDMNAIVDEVGQKWSTLNKDQQIALAQTVAGMRQYNNFIALMENYDTFKMNVDIAVDSEGTLERQAEIYAESWEAAKDRVAAAAEEIYTKLLDDDFFIDLLNLAEKGLTLLSKFMDYAGGLKGILASLTGTLLIAFRGKAAEGLKEMVRYMKDFTGLSKKQAIEYKKQAAQVFGQVSPKGGERTELQEA